MRTPESLVANDATSAQEHTRGAVVARRLASGVRAQLAVDRALTPKERKVLEDAAQVLDGLARLRGDAAKLVKQHRDALAAREKAIGSALRAAIGPLSAVADQIAFVGAVDKFALEDARSRFRDPRALDTAAAEALESLAVVLARQPSAKTPRALAEEIALKFRAAKASIEAGHKELIADLAAKGAAAAGRSGSR
jgi:hypothetical protein